MPAHKQASKRAAVKEFRMGASAKSAQYKPQTGAKVQKSGSCTVDYGMHWRAGDSIAAIFVDAWMSLAV
jgi:hypothetical protein